MYEASQRVDLVAERLAAVEINSMSMRTCMNFNINNMCLKVGRTAKTVMNKINTYGRCRNLRISESGGHLLDEGREAVGRDVPDGRSSGEQLADLLG